MICSACRDTHHDDCPGTGWCDCQHAYGRAAVITPDGQSSGTRVLLGVLGPPDADGNRTGVVYPPGIPPHPAEPEPGAS